MGVNMRNSEGYYDPTAYEALSNIEREAKAARAFRPIVYICSPLSGDMDANQEAARRYCRYAVDSGYIPIAPHIYFTQFMNEHSPKERNLALFMDTSFFRHAVFAGKLDIEDELNRIGIFTISFSCKPYRYDAAGTESVTMATGEILLNPYPFTSKPILRIEGKGKGTLTIQSEGSNATWNFTSIDGYVEADSEQMNFYKDAEPKNDTVSGDGFPLLYPGENAISFSGGITAVTVVPRWCCL